MPSPVRFAVVKKLLESKGYSLDHFSSSHAIFKKAGVKNQVVTVHHNMVKHA